MFLSLRANAISARVGAGGVRCSHRAAGAPHPRVPSPRLHLIRNGVHIPLGRVSVGIPLPRRDLGACLEFVAFLVLLKQPKKKKKDPSRGRRPGLQPLRSSTRGATFASALFLITRLRETECDVQLTGSIHLCSAAVCPCRERPGFLFRRLTGSRRPWHPVPLGASLFLPLSRLLRRRARDRCLLTNVSRRGRAEISTRQS